MTILQNEPGVTQMLEQDSDSTADQLSVKRWLRTREEAGKRIDPTTAEVMWTYTQTLDPYGVYPDLREECRQVGRAYFARSPESDIWVWFGDLDGEIRENIWQLHNSRLESLDDLFDELAIWG